MLINVNGVVTEVDDIADNGAMLQQPRAPSICALVNLTLSGFDVSGIESATGVTFAMVVDVGMIWLFFTQTMDDAEYSWNVSSSVGRANVTATTVDYIEITVVDNEGQPADSAKLAVQIFKVQ